MGVLQIKSAPQLEREQNAQRQIDEQKKEEQNRPVIVDNLAAHVRHCWGIAKSHRARKTSRLTNCLRLRKGEYTAEKLNSIREAGGSTAYMNIIGTKCRAAKSWLSDLYAGSGDKPFQLEPTPIADLDPSIQKEMIAMALQVVSQTAGDPETAKQMAEALLQQNEDRIKDEMLQEAEARMEKMSDYIEDILVEGGFREQFEAFIDDLVTYPTAIFKGVIYSKEKQIKWKEDEQGNWLPVIDYKLSRKFKRVSRFNFYESPSMVQMGDSWSIEHIQYTPQDLTRMRGARGYNNRNIELALDQYRKGGLREWAFESGERERLEGKNSYFVGGYEMIDALEFHGYVQGKQLVEWGIAQPIDDLYEEFSTTITVIGGYTIRAMINPDPTGKPNYYKASFRSVPNSFDGEALPEILEDIQDVANATIRALVNNMAIGAQPQVAIDISQQPAGANITGISAGKVWPYSSRNGQTKAGVSFFSPEIKSQELLNVYERFERYADERSGIPAYAYGSDNAAGAGKTASGLSMLMNAASKSIKSIVRDVDIGVIEKMTTSIYQSAMLDPDVPSEYKGDAKVKARGSDALMHKEATAMRQLEFMNMTMNPIDSEIIGYEGRREMLEEASKNAEFPLGRVVPSRNEFEQRTMTNEQNQQRDKGKQEGTTGNNEAQQPR